MKCVAVVPVKMNNTRLPGKNIKAFTNGSPLCTYIINSLKKVKGIDDIYVYCSNEKIKDYIPRGCTFLKRSEKLDTDTTKINEVLSSFAFDVDADVYLMSHVTAPFINHLSIQKGLDAVLNGGYDSSFSARTIQDFLWKDGKPLNYDLDSIPRTQDLPLVYQETSGFYCYKKEVILKMNRRIGNRPKMIVVSEIESVDIDNEEDFIIADSIFNNIIVRQ